MSSKEEVNMNFETIKRNFERRLWSKAMVRAAVRKGVLTPEQYQKITSEPYN